MLACYYQFLTIHLIKNYSGGGVCVIDHLVFFFYERASLKVCKGEQAS